MTILAEVLTWLTYVAFFAQISSGPPAPDPLTRLRAKVNVEAVATEVPAELAGEYANPSRELLRTLGGTLSGERLYLFPDNTFLYCEWSDISPLSITDKGTWTVRNAVLKLNSDPDVTWKTDDERRYLVVRRTSHAREILLVGIDRSLSSFEEGARGDPDALLVVLAMERDESFRVAKAKKVKAELMKDLWRPDPPP
ncbi:MAG TPA: hypothetical protein VJO53_12590 [Candidatus Acidoferrales bacterium]|nr:hypothetical protein [Candidatus Acidoferrales bacterium]